MTINTTQAGILELIEQFEEHKDKYPEMYRKLGYLANMVQAIRQFTIVCVNPDGVCSNGRGYGEDLLTRLMQTTDAIPFQSPKYHRIRKEAI